MQDIGSKILIINIGSASKKYSVCEGTEELVFFHFEKDGEKFLLNVKGKSKFEKDEISLNDYKNSLEFLLNYLYENLKIKLEDFYVLSFRIVAPGSYFLNHKEIDNEYIDKLCDAQKYAGLHIDPVIEEIKKAKKIFKNQKYFGVSDSAFHKNKLVESNYYGISKDLQDKYDYKRFGYHGISVESVIEKIKNIEGSAPEKILICHLGGGVSVTVLKNGKSIDNTMGFSPLEGPVMATRSGNIDFTLIKDLFQKEKIKDLQKQDEFLFEKSGLLGLSGISSDLRVLKRESFKGNKDAKFAVDVYVYNIVKQISQMIGVLKGIDLFVFTGTIGYRADFIRELILDEIKWHGFVYDIEKNSGNDINSDYFYINEQQSKIKILVCETDEMEMILKITLKLA